MHAKSSGRRSGGQLALPLGSVEMPVEHLRSAYERARLSVPFEAAMALPHLRICLRNLALSSGLRRPR